MRSKLSAARSAFDGHHCLPPAMSDRSSDTQHGEAPGLPRSQVVSLFDPRLATERRHFLKQFFTVRPTYTS